MERKLIMKRYIKSSYVLDHKAKDLTEKEIEEEYGNSIQEEMSISELHNNDLGETRAKLGRNSGETRRQECRIIKYRPKMINFHLGPISMLSQLVI